FSSVVIYPGLVLILSWFLSSDGVRWVCVGVLDQVFVPCPHLESLDFRLELLQNQSVISSFCSPNQSRCSPSPVSSGVNLSAPNPAPILTLTNQSFCMGFNITVLGESSHGVYVCHGQSNFPPPLRKKLGPEQVLVLVQGHQCGLIVDPGPDQIQDLMLVWIIVVVCLSGYSLFISISWVVLWVKHCSCLLLWLCSSGSAPLALLLWLCSSGSAPLALLLWLCSSDSFVAVLTHIFFIFQVKFRHVECERDYVNTKPSSTHRQWRKNRKQIHVVT
uniref:Immunoglobulin subtype domain-containing protein n=1 Tax=Periophthalmus magnuspinnatus TaxID=409849 RepID=A0A3B4AHD5_9GOBI